MKLIKPITITDAGSSLSRASQGTYIDSDHLLKIANNHIPRYDYSGGIFRGMLLEAAATNILVSPADLSNAAWSATDITRSYNQSGPEGATGATLLTQGVAGTATFAQITAGTVNTNVAYTASCYFKKGTADWIMLQSDNAAAGGGSKAWFNLTTGTIGTVINYGTGTGATATITAAANGWYKCTVGGIPNAGTVTLRFLCLVPTADAVTTRLNSATVYICYPQQELGTAATTWVNGTRALETMNGTVICNVPETDQPVWSSGTTYVADNLVLCTDHKIYKCLITNSASSPPANISGTSPKWLFQSYDNRWKMLDGAVGSQTTLADRIQISLTPGVNYDSIALLDLVATSVSIYIPDTGFTDTFDLTNNSHINNAYSYFFDPIILSDTVCVLGMTPVSTRVDISINYVGSNAMCGTLVLGMAKELGGTQYNPTIGITDYSTKVTDVFGVTTVLQRVYAKRMSCELFLENTAVDDLQRTLAAYRTTPVVWVGADALFSAMIIYGFYKSFSIAIPYPNNSTCTIEVEGLS